MRIESKLCHVSDNKAVVQVIGWLNDEKIGSALAEGTSVEIAEDKAISRLNKRISTFTNNLQTKKSNNEEKSNKPLKVKIPNSEKIEKNNQNLEPNDWSSELTAIDLEIERLKWSRDDEINFLKTTFGYNNRNKITTYNDIVKYLSLLKKTNRKSHSTDSSSNIYSLIEESESILIDLSWDHIQGREYLQKEFNVSSRKELNEEQLISFVEKLKTIRNQYSSN